MKCPCCNGFGAQPTQMDMPIAAVIALAIGKECGAHAELTPTDDNCQMHIRVEWCRHAC